MQQRASAVYAAIDIGSNTIEGLIARCSPNNVQTIAHQTTMVRLGESVDNKGEIARDKFKMAPETFSDSHCTSSRGYSFG
jgi:exopolyphosphatase/pppGpp-phosphohydrolase